MLMHVDAAAAYVATQVLFQLTLCYTFCYGGHGTLLQTVDVAAAGCCC